MRPPFSSPILGGNIRRTPCLRGFDTHRSAGSSDGPTPLEESRIYFLAIGWGILLASGLSYMGIILNLLCVMDSIKTRELTVS